MNAFGTRSIIAARRVEFSRPIKSHVRGMAHTKSPFELKPKYPDFMTVQASRPDFQRNLPITYTKTPDPEWKYGKGASDVKAHESKHVEIDPNEPGRPMIANYRLLVSAIARPISFVSTVGKDGTKNLAPMSYFQVVDHDPPTLVIGFSARQGRPKDTQRNLEETGECVINVVSEHFVEAVNATSLDVPYGKSEWELSGLTPASSTTIKPERVVESIFSIEGKLLEMKSLDYHGAGKAGRPFGSMAIIEAKRFWVREDAINESRDEISLDKMRPSVQLGGIQYGRIRDTFELPRPSLAEELERKNLDLAKFLG